MFERILERSTSGRDFENLESLLVVKGVSSSFPLLRYTHYEIAKLHRISINRRYRGIDQREAKINIGGGSALE